MNEGDNFGTASGGANQPQFSNSFDRPTGAITSSPEGGVPTVSTGGASNSSKFFGGRSKYSSRSSSGSQVNFAAAQQIASNPNTPQFFSEAVIANNPAPVETERKPKKGLIFAVVGAVALILVVVLVVALLPKGGGTGDTPEERLANLGKLIDDYRDNVKYYESIHKMAREYGFGFNPSGIKDEEAYKENKSALDNNLSRIKDFRSELDKYNNVSVKDINTDDQVAVDDYIASLKKSLDGRINAYESYSKLLNGLTHAYATKGSEDAIKEIKEALPNDNSKAAGELVDRYYDSLKNYQSIGMKNNCNEKPNTSVCVNNLANIGALNTNVENDSSISSAFFSIASGISGDSDDPLVIMNKISNVEETEQK